MPDDTLPSAPRPATIVERQGTAGKIFESAWMPLPGYNPTPMGESAEWCVSVEFDDSYPTFVVTLRLNGLKGWQEEAKLPVVLLGDDRRADLKCTLSSRALELPSMIEPY